MCIVCIGQAALDEKVLGKLTERIGEDVAVYTPQDTAGKRNPVKEFAIQTGIPVSRPRSMRVPEVYEEYTRFKPDLNVMASATSIKPAEEGENSCRVHVGVLVCIILFITLPSFS
jgi:methionyl-tRNA formyltransferase